MGLPVIVAPVLMVVALTALLSLIVLIALVVARAVVLVIRVIRVIGVAVGIGALSLRSAPWIVLIPILLPHRRRCGKRACPHAQGCGECQLFPVSSHFILLR